MKAFILLALSIFSGFATAVSTAERIANADSVHNMLNIQTESARNRSGGNKVIVLPMIYPSNSGANYYSNPDDLMRLIQAQTDAIRDLSDKIDTLEQRIDNLERERR